MAVTNPTVRYTDILHAAGTFPAWTIKDLERATGGHPTVVKGMVASLVRRNLVKKVSHGEEGIWRHGGWRAVYALTKAGLREIGHL